MEMGKMSKTTTRQKGRQKPIATNGSSSQREHPASRGGPKLAPK